MGQVRYGPHRPYTFEPLSKRSLRILHALLATHESTFLLGDFLALYPRLSRQEARTQGIGFEVLCLAAELKECVLVGWGDGRDADGDGKVAKAWLEEVWGKVETDLQDLASGDAVESRTDIDAAIDWIQGVKIHKIGEVETDSAVFIGHYLLYHPPVSPALQDVLDIPAQRTEKAHSAASTVLPLITEETIWGYILDYPTTMPANENFLDNNLRRQNVVQVNYHQVFRDGPLMGTEYFCSPLPSDLRKVKGHFERYRQRLEGVVDLSLLLNGVAQGAASAATYTLQQALEDAFTEMRS
ncbi:hypothetical protein FFLO_02692 [Filobasidium floriforme]|uniref:Uncharacterized protein n=1 Tax=Filobasidium floriforme TaxID=5210 RepID=A0A8K0NRK6_9TREE|nr:hypothetical protein FFLO_02692 [Filobasidium floriforme]